MSAHGIFNAIPNNFSAFIVHLPLGTVLRAALFSAVENGHMEKARTILESTDVDINR